MSKLIIYQFLLYNLSGKIIEEKYYKNMKSIIERIEDFIIVTGKENEEKKEFVKWIIGGTASVTLKSIPNNPLTLELLRMIAINKIEVLD